MVGSTNDALLYACYISRRERGKKTLLLGNSCSGHGRSGRSASPSHVYVASEQHTAVTAIWKGSPVSSLVFAHMKLRNRRNHIQEIVIGSYNCFFFSVSLFLLHASCQSTTSFLHGVRDEMEWVSALPYRPIRIWGLTFIL